MKNFAVDIDYDMVGVGYAAKNLNYIYIYGWKATWHFTKKDYTQKLLN